jgi:hypothetical protein
MADIRIPDFVRRVVGIMATDNDATTLDTILSVGTLTLAASFLTPLVTTVLPIVPGIVALPLTAGLLAVVVNRVS